MVPHLHPHHRYTVYSLFAHDTMALCADHGLGNRYGPCARHMTATVFHDKRQSQVLLRPH